MGDPGGSSSSSSPTSKDRPHRTNSTESTRSSSRRSRSPRGTKVTLRTTRGTKKQLFKDEYNSKLTGTSTTSLNDTEDDGSGHSRSSIRSEKSTKSSTKRRGSSRPKLRKASDPSDDTASGGGDRDSLPTKRLEMPLNDTLDGSTRSLGGSTRSLGGSTRSLGSTKSRKGSSGSSSKSSKSPKKSSKKTTESSTDEAAPTTKLKRSTSAGSLSSRKSKVKKQAAAAAAAASDSLDRSTSSSDLTSSSRGRKQEDSSTRRRSSSAGSLALRKIKKKKEKESQQQQQQQVQEEVVNSSSTLAATTTTTTNDHHPVDKDKRRTKSDAVDPDSSSKKSAGSGSSGAKSSSRRTKVTKKDDGDDNKSVSSTKKLKRSSSVGTISSKKTEKEKEKEKETKSNDKESLLSPTSRSKRAGTKRFIRSSSLGSLNPAKEKAKASRASTSVFSNKNNNNNNNNNISDQDRALVDAAAAASKTAIDASDHSTSSTKRVTKRRGSLNSRISLFEGGIKSKDSTAIDASDHSTGPKRSSKRRGSLNSRISMFENNSSHHSNPPSPPPHQTKHRSPRLSPRSPLEVVRGGTQGGTTSAASKKGAAEEAQHSGLLDYMLNGAPLEESSDSKKHSPTSSTTNNNKKEEVDSPSSSTNHDQSISKSRSASPVSSSKRRGSVGNLHSRNSFDKDKKKEKLLEAKEEDDNSGGKNTTTTTVLPEKRNTSPKRKVSGKKGSLGDRISKFNSPQSTVPAGFAIGGDILSPRSAYQKKTSNNNNKLSAPPLLCDEPAVAEKAGGEKGSSLEGEKTTTKISKQPTPPTTTTTTTEVTNNKNNQVKSPGKMISQRKELPVAGKSVKDRLAMFNKASAPPPDLMRTRPGVLSSKHMKHVMGMIGEKMNHNDPSDDSSKGGGSSKPHSVRISTQEIIPEDGLLLNDEEEPRKRISIDKAHSFSLAKSMNAFSDLHERRNRLKASRSKSGLKEFVPNKGHEMHKAITARVDEDFTSFTPPSFPKDESDIKLIKDALNNNFVFNNLEPDDIERMVAAFQPFKVSRGEIIIKQGDAGDYFYVIASGDVTFHIINRKVGTAGKGKSFGDLALLYTCPRAATVKAASQPTSLFRVDQKTFHFVMRSPTKKSMEVKKKLLKGISFMSQLGDADIERLCSVMTPVLFDAQDIIVQRGDEGDCFYILKDGTVRVTDIVVGGTRYEDLTLQPGDYFGEGALVSSETRIYDVVAATKGSAFSIDRMTFQKVLGDFEKLIARAQDRKRLNGIKIFKKLGLSSDDFDSLVGLVTNKEYTAKNIVFKEGHTTDAAMFFVRDGSVHISTQDDCRREDVKSGGYFGQEHLLADSFGARESSCLIEANYTVTVTSETCTLGVLTLEDCRTVFDTTAMDFGGSSSDLLSRRATIRKSIKSKLNLEDLNRDTILGEGQFGEVWLVTATIDGGEIPQEFALKIQSKDDPIREENAIEAIHREMEIIKKLNHPFVIGLVETYECDDYLYMLMEVIKGGELWSVIHVEDEEGEWTSGIPEANAKFYGFILCDTLAYMHRQKIVFRDLKPENVLIDYEGYPVLVDFGFAKILTENTYTFCGTPNYLAPEVVMNSGHGFGADHWALGVVIYEMIAGENPFYFEGMDQISLFKAIVQDKMYPLPDTVSKDLVDLVQRLLEKEPVQRLGMLAGGEKDILKHKWYDDLDTNKLRNKEAPAPWKPSA